MNMSTRVADAGLLEHTEGKVLLQVLWITIFAALTALGARFEIPYTPVPFTLQTFFVLLAGAFLGARNGAVSQLVYLSAGAVGAPVFSGGAFGFWQILGPTGGYLVSFPIAAAVTGYLVSRRRGFLRSLMSMAVGLFLIFFLGTLWLYAFALHSWGQALRSGFLIFSLWDVLKLAAAATIYHELAKRWPKLPA